MLRTGRAGSNTATDHITVLGEAIGQVPAAHRRRLLVRSDGAGAFHALLDWLTAKGTVRGRSVEYSIGFALTEPLREAIRLVPARVWTPALEADGDIRDGAAVAELTGLIDPHLMAGWPAGMRVIVRRERPPPRRATVDLRGHPARQGLRPGPVPLARVSPSNQTWLTLVMAAADLIAWTRLLTLTGDAAALATCEPKALRAHGLLVQQNTTIPEGTDLGGLSLRDARSCYALLIAQLYLNELCTVHLGTQQTLLWAIKPYNLVRLLGSYTEGGTTAAAAFVEFCRYVVGRSPLSAPLIPHKELLLIPAPLVSPIAYERSLLRAAAADPSRSGALGRALGDRTRRWAERLGTIPGCRVAERVKVKGHNGRTLGDLDVVVWDPNRALLGVFETKWPVDAASLAESYKVDELFSSGREQLKRLRCAIESDAAVIMWPLGWEVPLTETNIDWWVASAQQLDSSPEPGSTGDLRVLSVPG